MPRITSREIRLASRPQGWPTRENFTLASAELGPPAEGQVLVRNLCISVDPYMRGRMNDVKSYTPPFKIGEPLEGGAVGEVVESRAPGLSPGDIVTSMRGWREYFVADSRDVRRIAQPAEPVSLHLGVLGLTGLTAWVGLNLAETKTGDRVFVSAAAGAVGSVAGQLAKLRGCTVIGSAGSDEKTRMVVDELGFDAAFNYRGADLVAALRTHAPDGIDVYFDNVGGDHLEAALYAMRTHGRIAVCGMISRYNDETPPPGPRNMILIIGKRLTMKGFIATDWYSELPRFIAEVGPHVRDGRVRVKETVVRGIENAPQAFIDMLRGENVGKMIVSLHVSEASS
jgi:NADPH-dependent curcumin reductase CurA